MRDYIITVDESENELMHYGVVGMHWHHRKAAAYAAKGNVKKAQKHLDKKIANNIKKNGFYYKRLEKVTSKDIEKARKRANRKNTLLKAAAMTAGAAAVGVGVGKAYNKHRSNKLANNPDTRNKVKTATDRLKAYQEAMKGASNSADAARNTAFNFHSTVNNSSNRMNSNNRTSVNRSHMPKPKPNRNTVNNTQNAQSVADRLKAYQEAANRASSAADNARNVAYGRNKKKRK